MSRWTRRAWSRPQSRTEPSNTEVAHASTARQRFWRGVWVALRRRPSRLVGFGIVALFTLMAIAGPWLYPARLPYDADNVYAPISWDHPLSTDFEGVDVLALVITGTRGVLLVAAAAGLVTAVFGWGGLARAVRSQTLSLRERGFIEAARGLGMPTRHIVVKELLPNVAPYIATNLLIAVTGYIYAQVGLYFLGVLPLTTNNWGVMLNFAVFQSGALIAPNALPYLLAPMGAILLLTLGVVLIIDAMEEIFNPRLRGS